jgi:hypothetical protein
MAKLDPNNCCIMFDECLFWALVHDIIAHPLIALTLYQWQPAIDFHNWTSQKAWKRKL